MKTEKQTEAIARGNELLAAVEASVDRVKSLDFPLGKFREAATVKAWATNHGFSVLKVNSSSLGFSIEVRRSEDFEGGSSNRWERIGKTGVTALVGTLKRSAVAKQVPVDDASNEEKREAQAARSEEFGIEALEDQGENLSFPADFPEDLRLYGDPVNLKFPNDTEERAANARVRFKQFADTYSEESSRAVVHERIVRAELREGIEPGFDPEDPLDALLPTDLKDELSKTENNLAERRFAKRGELVVVSKAADGSDVPDDEVRMFGIVMKPEVPDADGTVTSHAEIESANLQFMRDFGTMGLMHSKAIGGTDDEETDRVTLVQNVIAPIDFDFPTDGGAKAIARGTWYQEIWSNDPEIVKRVKVDKTITGLSIGGFAKTVPITEIVDGVLVVNVPENYSPAQKRAIKEVVAKAEGDPALDRFVDLRVEEVSLVDAAANEEEFFIIKRRSEMTTKNPAAEQKNTEVAPTVAPATPTPTPAAPTPAATTPAPAPETRSAEPTIADQIADGFERGVKAVLASVAPASPTPEPAAPAAPAPAPAPTVTTPVPEPPSESSEVVVELKKLNERIDGLEAENKKAGTARAVARGESAPEGTVTPPETEGDSSPWTGTAIHARFGKKK